MFWLYQSRLWDVAVRLLIPLFVGLYILLVYECQDALIPWVRHTYRWAVAFGVVQAAVLIAGVSLLILTKLIRERRHQSREARRNHILSLLSDYAISEQVPASRVLHAFSTSPA